MKEIRILVMDVDGTLTDGGIYIGGSGEMMKKFNVRDGYGIHHILRIHDIIPAIITGRDSEILERRCKELEITELIQGSSDKAADLKRIAKKHMVSFENIAYIGDDISDLGAMKLVGIRGCPSDAVSEVKEFVDFVSSYPGGYGAVREFIDWIVKQG